METYEFAITCTNCGDRAVWNIVKGVRIDDFGREAVCPVCGCKVLAPLSGWISHPGWTYDMPCATATNAPVDTWSGHTWIGPNEDTTVCASDIVASRVGALRELGKQ